MILLIAHLFLVSQATANEHPQVRQSYCTELLPQVLQNGTGLPLPLSIEVAANCGAKPSLSEVCTENVSCMILPDVSETLAGSMFNKKFAALTYGERQRVLRALLKADDEARAKDPSTFTSSIEWIPSTLVCMKKTMTTASGVKKVCPEPDECKIPKGDVSIHVAEFDDHMFDQMNERIISGDIKIFNPAQNSNPTVPAK